MKSLEENDEANLKYLVLMLQGRIQQYLSSTSGFLLFMLIHCSKSFLIFGMVDAGSGSGAVTKIILLNELCPIISHKSTCTVVYEEADINTAFTALAIGS